MFKKCLGSLLVLSLVAFSIPALAEATPSNLDYAGAVEYRDTVTLSAPFGGNLKDFTLRVGDAVTAGQPLFTLSTTKVYAPFDGTVRGLQANPGDDAAQVAARYGALLYLEPAGKYTVSASTSGAYDSTNTHNANRYVNPGDIVYMQSTEDDARIGTGVVTTVSGRSFTVEVLQSNLDPEDNVDIYKDEALSTGNRLARSARIQQAEATAITAEGSMLRCAVTEGQSVKRGDLLLETVAGALDGLQPVSDTVVSPVDGVLVSLPQTAGSAVTQDEVLATLYAQDALWVTFDVDESDLDAIAIGQNVKVELDALAARDQIAGMVESISYLSSTQNDGAKYTVYVSLEDTANLRSGMSVTVHLR
ncbi:MAG: HlyD family efflux transporter periplasmic adaptor subunit [Eubacteriales bacterium]|nr:HlyD family efflux transporter periplasmic adaptor subunit [Eubacteriales bacterium]